MKARYVGEKIANVCVIDEKPNSLHEWFEHRFPPFGRGFITRTAFRMIIRLAQDRAHSLKTAQEPNYVYETIKRFEPQPAWRLACGSRAEREI